MRGANAVFTALFSIDVGTTFDASKPSRSAEWSAIDAICSCLNALYDRSVGLANTPMPSFLTTEIKFCVVIASDPREIEPVILRIASP